MSSDQNKALVQRVVEEVYNQGNESIVQELYASNYAHHDLSMPGDPALSLNDFLGVLRNFRSSFPDMRVHIEDLTAEGNKVVERWSCAGTNLGSWQGVPPTHKSINVEGIRIFRIEGGKIVEAWVSFDPLVVVRQMDLIPEAAGV